MWFDRLPRHGCDEPAATCQRLLQFRAGPGQLTFAACDLHRHLLETGDVANFFGRPEDRVEELQPDSGTECHFCREGG